ncbi:MAG: type II toxin-antitoxin system prevent-host-death family antitoxin [Acidobacteria bacterium]|nr:type II toxin-antitoxin system prevent-host-death family antitoxin [Acidobacteriota bacterium]
MAALVEEVKRGEEIVLTDHERPVARIVAPQNVTAGNGSVRPRFSCLAGKIHLAPDFDEPVEDFKEYME